MKNLLRISFIVLIFIFALNITVKAEEINFEKGDFKEVLAKVTPEKKILMIDFYTDWCKWCVELDKKVYTDKDVAEFANTHQINWKIDAEKGEGIELAKKYLVNGYPTIIFLDEKGEEVDRIVGYFPAKDFLKKMMEFYEGVNTYSAFSKILDKNPDDVKANYFIGERIVNNEGDFKKAETYFQKIIDKDPNNKEGLKPGAILYLAIGSGDINRIKQFIQDYPESGKCKDAYIALASKYYQDEMKFQQAKSVFDEAFEKYGKEDEDLKQNYVSYLFTYMGALVKTSKEEDGKKGLELGNECLEYTKGSVNEASTYYYISNFYYNLKDKANANTYIDKALQIREAKAYKELKEKINK
jgi:thioredoxin-related protein